LLEITLKKANNHMRGFKRLSQIDRFSKSKNQPEDSWFYNRVTKEFQLIFRERMD
jgi:hypothetical protein